MKKIVACFFLLACHAPAECVAQERPKLFDAVEREFRENEPRWKIERLDVKREAIPKLSVVFRSRAGQAAVEVEVWDSVANARDVFTGRAAAEANTAGTRVKKNLPGFGDEGHAWVNPRSTAWPSVSIRKGPVYISVFAPDLATARRFARRVLELIPKSEPGDSEHGTR